MTIQVLVTAFSPWTAELRTWTQYVRNKGKQISGPFGYPLISQAAGLGRGYF